MTHSPRRPDSCEHRIPLGPGEHSCGLATRILGDTPAVKLRTDDSICRECCRRPLRNGARLNPVVASLVFTAAEARPPQEMPASEFIERHWVRQFAMTSLETADSIGPPQDELPAVPKRTRNLGADRSSQPLRLGLVGPNSRFGLGHINRDIAKHLPIQRWLIPLLPGDPDVPPPGLSFPAEVRDPQDSRLPLEEWLRGLDAILFVETPLFPGLCRKARELGVLVMCHPNWEWLHPGLDWLDDVDVMLAPTRRTASMLNQWKRQFGFRWIVEDLPWPIDAETFSFRRRYRAERFVYVHGSGGFRAFRNGVESDLIARKGLATLLQAVREAPQIPLIIYGDEPPGVSVPPNVEFRAPPEENRQLYVDGDICIQPSLWEGLGLPLLECQAAGMPLITTDLAPMNEHSPFAVIPAKEVSACLKPDYWIAAADLCPDDIARVMRNTWRRWIPFASSRARRFIVREHNWRTTRGPLVEKISTWSRSLQAGH